MGLWLIKHKIGGFMKIQLTSKQQRFLDYLQRKIAKSGLCPSLRQAAADLGVSHAAIAQMLRALEEKGYVRREGRYSRKVYLLSRTHEAAALQRWREIPIIGRVTAGLPMYAQTEWDGSIVLDAAVYRSQNLFALRVKGNSMKDAGILSGDLAICEPRQFAQNSEIVVALINSEEATVKRFFLHDDHIELRPENSDYAPMRYGFNEVLIQGKVIGIHRGPEGIQ
ncbi:MAG: transcriptional repressor LexA [Deltaproteobacteria bacterium]